MESLLKCFETLVRIVKENPKEAAAVVTAVGLTFGGYGKGYCDGRRESDAIYEKRYLK